MVNLPSPTTTPPTEGLQPDVSELIVPAPRFICETYIFDPVSEEESLGRLFAVAETEDRGGIGSELLDLTIQALQREYYRDPSRGVLASFESALHQANLVLHDTAEQGVRDWMGYFHVAVGVLAKDTLHISTAGGASVLLVRRGRLTTVSTDLSHSPITNPLRTFAQVASGTLLPRDVLFWGTSSLAHLYRPEELLRLAIDHSASTISTRLQQLYHDQGGGLPLAMLTISLLPQHIAAPRQDPEYAEAAARRVPRSPANNLVPRKPIIIHRSWLKTILVFLARMVAEGWLRFKTSLWPHVVRGSRGGGRLLARVSLKTGQGVSSLTAKQLQRWRPATTATPHVPTTPETSPGRAWSLRFSPPKLPGVRTLSQWPRQLAPLARQWLSSLPRSSRIFAGITLLLAVALIVSIGLLRHKRAEDAAIVRASEILHDARNSTNAAEDALIYDNREQARTLLAQASTKTDAVATTGLYGEEVQALRSQIQATTDRLQKVVRSSTENTTVVGDFASVVGNTAPAHLAFVNGALYSFHPEQNTVVRLTLDGSTEAVTSATEGIGFFTTTAAQAADKQIVIGTDTPGVALFDAKDNTLSDQEIEFPSSDTEITSIATYGSRLYLYDAHTRNIIGYTKTLRGYSGAAPWITATNFPKDDIVSIGVDGSIYTLHRDGAIRKLLKGEPVAFTPDPVDPPLSSATKLLKSEDLENMYVLDTTHKRVVIFDTNGKLQRQLFLDVAANLRDIALAADEKTLYALDGTRVLAIPLAP